MSVRVTQADMEEIIELDATISVTPFIRIANLIVDEQLEPIGLLSEARLFEVELWLAAHFYCVRDPRSASESAGVSVSYQQSVALNLQVSVYGQQAMMLDTTGTLAAMNKGQPSIPMIENLTMDEVN